jgi:ABC-type transporter Mla subunit MlaD
MGDRRNLRIDRRLAGFALLAAVTAVILAVTGRGGTGHWLQVTVPDATGVIPGERIVEAGLTVGSIQSADVTRNGEAHIVMAIGSSYWPLPRDTTLTLRIGGTIKYSDRYIEIARGHDTAVFPDGDTVPSSRLIAPVEYDTIFNIFDKPTRAGLKSTLDNGGPLFSQAAPAFRRALPVAAPALAQADAVIRDLADDQGALSTLVSSTAQLSDAVAASNPGVRTLLTGAADTFSSLGSQSAALQQVFSSAPAALRTSGRAADHLSRTLPRVAALAQRLSPGVTELGAIAAPLDSTLQELVRVEPLAAATLHTIRDSGPALESLLSSARITLMPRLGSIGKQAARQLDCLRPYTPEDVAMIQNFLGGMAADGPRNPHVRVFHALVSAYPFPNTMPVDMAQIQKVFPGLKMSYPTVPGETFGQPWYQPQCGITAKNFDPNNDPEAHTYDPHGNKLVPYR